MLFSSSHFSHNFHITNYHFQTSSDRADCVDVARGMGARLIAGPSISVDVHVAASMRSS